MLGLELSCGVLVGSSQEKTHRAAGYLGWNMGDGGHRGCDEELVRRGCMWKRF